jgi:hypothetical protein
LLSFVSSALLSLCFGLSSASSVSPCFKGFVLVAACRATVEVLTLLHYVTFVW